MTIIKKNEGHMYTPTGHDESVVSRALLKTDCIDFHVTQFGPKDSMTEEVHENEDHLFFILSGRLEVLNDGNIVGILEKGDAIYIPHGEVHQVQNPDADDSTVFFACTYRSADV